MKRDTITPGAAAVHLVCADLLLAGHRAFIAPEGAAYDVVLDDDSRFYRIQVKSTRAARLRLSRPASAAVYQFVTNRSHRPNRVGQKSQLKFYDESQVDIVACVALDIRAIAYFPVVGRFFSGLHLYAPETAPFIRRGVNQRRNITEFPISSALRRTPVATE